MCKCNSYFIETSYSVICSKCGSEKPHLKMDTYFNMCSAPLQMGYDRSLRWRNKIDKMVGFNNGPRWNDPVWKYLEQNRNLIKQPQDICDCLRKSNLKNKHYDSIRVFSTVFTNIRVCVDALLIREQLNKLFKYIHYRWVVTQNSAGFFSYNWLLHFCLVLLESPLIIYLKPPTCKKRSDKYLEKLGSILPLKNDETMNRDTISTHLLNEL